MSKKKKKKKKIPACLICFCQKWPENLIINFFWPKYFSYSVHKIYVVHIYKKCQDGELQMGTHNTCLYEEKRTLSTFWLKNNHLKPRAMPHQLHIIQSDEIPEVKICYGKISIKHFH